MGRNAAERLAIVAIVRARPVGRVGDGKLALRRVLRASQVVHGTVAYGAIERGEVAMRVALVDHARAVFRLARDAQVDTVVLAPAEEPRAASEIGQERAYV